MKQRILTGVLAVICCVFCLAAQQQGQAGRGGQTGGQTAAPAAPAPTPEQQAVNALVAAKNANDADGLIKAAEALAAGFPSSPYVELALTMEADVYQQVKKDPIKAQLTFERVLTANPRSVAANLAIGELITQQTNEKAFDFNDKMASAEKNLKAALDVLNGPKINPQMTDQQWDSTKQSYLAEGHNDLGMIALLRKNFDAAVEEFTQATTLSPAEPAFFARLAHAQQQAGKNDAAIATCDKLLADPNLNPAIKNLVTQVKANAEKAKANPPAAK